MAQITDVSPTPERTKLTFSGMSATGRGLTIAASKDGKRVYIGNNAGVWRSDDSGVNWKHMVRPQPKKGSTSVPGALFCLNVYDLAVAKDPDIVLASTGRDIRSSPKNGIYRSTDGGRNWDLVRPFLMTGQIVSAPDDPTIIFAACGTALIKGVNSGATWSTLPLPLSGGKVWHVVVGPGPDATRRIYALGDRMQFSVDGGANWNPDPACPVQGSPPSDVGGPSTRVIALHPSNPLIVYAIKVDGAARIGTVFRGDYTSAGAGTPAVWTQLSALPDFPNPNPPPPARLAHPFGTTPSGTIYICTHLTRENHLYLFISDTSSAFVSIGDSPATWNRIDGGPIHIDPHAVWVSSDFRLATDGGGRGKIWQVNDGGVYQSTDGGNKWDNGRGLSTLSPINVAVAAVKSRLAAISLHNGDNGGFFTSDGGKNWITADYQQGDNDACFVDPAQPSLMYVFAPRGDAGGSGVSGPHGFTVANCQLLVYVATGTDPMNAGDGTNQRRQIPGPTLKKPADWNVVSSFTESGYRPLILTLPGETPIPGGDFIAIVYEPAGAHLMRSNVLATATITSADWHSTVPGGNVFRQGPVLPNQQIGVVQATNGHIAPIFYVSDLNTDPRRSKMGTVTGLWKWTLGMPDWLAVLPKAGGPQAPLRFFVNPYKSENIYVLDTAHVWRSSDAGSSWKIDKALESALTENGAFPIDLKPSNGGLDPLDPGRTPYEALLQDMAFDPNDPKAMIAVGPAGVFSTSDGTTWDTVALASALNTRIMSTFLDTVTDAPDRSLYVATPFRGLLKLQAKGADFITLRVPSGAGTFKVFRTFTDPFITDPAHPNVAKLQKALTDAITTKAGAPHLHTLKTRDPKAADFASAFPIPFTIADVTGAKPFPVAHYNPDEVDFVASEIEIAVLFAAMELRLMVRRFISYMGITSAQALLTSLDLIKTQIMNAAFLVKKSKDIFGNNLKVSDVQRLPSYELILDFDESGPSLKVDFKGAVAPETDPTKKKLKYDFGHSLYDMVVNGDTESAQKCIDALGYAYINGALEAGGFFERPTATASDPKTFRGIWIGGDFYDVPLIRGELAVNDIPAQFGGTTRTLARLMALIRAQTFADTADPNGDLMWTLLNKAQTGTAKPALQSYLGGKFTYELNKLGWGPLGTNPDNPNNVASEVAIIQTVNPNKKYVVAWQNLEMTRAQDGTVSVINRDGHTLYQHSDVVDIIANTIAAYQ